jgi:hypothetical protein
MVAYPATTAIPPSGDSTGATDTARINTVLATGKIVQLAAGAYTINAALLPVTGSGLAGPGAALTTITQAGTAANGISILSGAAIFDVTLAGFTLTGPGSGTGIGILASAASGAQPVWRSAVTDVVVQSFGSDGIQLNNPLICRLDRVRSQLNGRRGFYVNTGTTLVLTSCSATGNTERGFYFQSLISSQAAGCGADTNGLGWELHQCQGVRVTSCDAVNNAAGGGVDGSSFKLNAGSNNVVASPYCTGNNAIGYLVTGGEFDSTLDCPLETAPGGSATASIQVDNGCSVVISNPNVVTAQSLAGLATTLAGGTSSFGRADYNLLTSTLAGGGQISQGSGAPSKPWGVNPVAGDMFFRTDTPSTANQRMYVCTVGGGTPTWVGIA